MKSFELKRVHYLPSEQSVVPMAKIPLRNAINSNPPTKRYDKCDDFTSSIIQFPYLCNILSSPACGVLVSQFIQCAIVCSTYATDKRVNKTRLSIVLINAIIFLVLWSIHKYKSNAIWRFFIMSVRPLLKIHCI